MLKSFSKRSLVINLILGILLGFVMYMIPLRFVEAIPGATITSPADVTSNILPSDTRLQVGGWGFLVIILSLLLLIFNFRLAIAVSGGVIFLLLMVFLISHKGSRDLVLSYQVFRNVIYVFFISYLPLHLVVHGIVRLLKRKRKVFTIWGVISFCVLLWLTTYAYFLAYILPSF